MKRRKALSVLLWGAGGAIAVPGILVSGCKPGEQHKDALTTDDVPLLNEIAETIIPANGSSPGAKDAKVGEFMVVYVADCFSQKDQQSFIDGLNKINNASKEKYGNTFLKLDAKQKHELLSAIDGESKKAKGHYFSMMKEATLFAYSTSEIGATKGLRYVQTPGRWDADVPYKKGDKCWA
jgi:hypothetical protein